MEGKALYDNFCKKSEYIPVFSLPWWLDAVCGCSNWDAFVIEKDGALRAAMPYYKTIRSGQNVITKPPLTQNNGILINYPPDIKHCNKFGFEEDVQNQAINFIESLDIELYEQQFHYSFTNWLPFYWRGYSCLPRYTYVIEDTSNIENIWNNFSGDIRKGIKKAERLVSVHSGLCLEKFYELCRKTFERQALSVPYPFELLQRLNDACAENDARHIFYAADSDGRVHSAVYLVWDSAALYLLITGSDPDLRSSQALSLLIYESIKLAAEKKLVFDFEGSVIKGIEHYFRDFGGAQKMYFRISKQFLNPQITV